MRALAQHVHKALPAGEPVHGEVAPVGGHSAAMAPGLAASLASSCGVPLRAPMRA